MNVDVLARIVETLSVRDDADILQRLVDGLTEFSGMKWAFVGEVIGQDRRSVRILSASGEDGPAPPLEYALAGTPCEAPAGNRQCIIPRDASTLYPNDDCLVRRGVECYVGMPLTASDGQSIGVLAGLDDRPRELDQQTRLIFDILATRAAAELERKQTLRALEHSEFRLSAAIEAIPDGIVLYDEDDRLVHWNSAFDSISRTVRPELRVGMTFAELAREVATKGVAPGGDTSMGDWAGREAPERAREREQGFREVILKDGRHFLRSERRTADGGSVGTWTNITGLKAIEEAYRRSEERYRTLFEKASQAMLVHDGVHIVQVNAAAARLYGYDTAQQMVGLEIAALVHEDDRAQFARRLAIFKETQGNLPPVRDRRIRRDGTIIYVEQSGTPVEVNGEHLMLGMYRDITREVQVEAALRDSEAKFRNLADGALQGICIHQNMRIVYANHAFAVMRGYTIPELMGMPVERLMTAEEYERILSLRNRRLDGEAVSDVDEYQGRRKDGSLFWLQKVRRDLVWDGAPAVQVSEIDITERKEATDRLRLFQSAVHDTIDGIVITRATGDQPIEYVNPAFEALTGYTSAEIIGRNCRLLQGGERQQPGLKTLRRAIASRTSARVDVRNYRKDGQPIDIELTVTPVFDDKGQVSHFVGLQHDVTQRRMFERQQEEQTRYLRQAESLAHVGNWRIEMPSGVLRWSEEVFRIYGYEPDEIIPTVALAMRAYHPEDRARVAQMLSETRRKGGEFEFRARILNRDGDVRHVRVWGLCVLGGKDSLRLMFGAIQDVTELTMAERQIVESEQRFRDFAEIASDWFWETGPDYRFTWVAGQQRRLDGSALETMIGQTRFEIDAGGDATADWETHRQDLAARREFRGFEYTVHGADGSDRQLSVSGKPLFDGAGRFLGYRGTGTDISARRRAERALIESRRYMQLILDSTADAIVTIDESGTVESFNAAAEKMFGYAANEIVGSNIEILMAEEFRQDHQKYLARYLKSGEQRIIGSTREVTGLRRDGSEFPIDLVIGEMIDNAGRRRFIGTIRDQTRIRETEEQLRQAQKMEAVGQLTGGIAHDFNNLLSVIMGNVQLLQRRLDDREETRPLLRDALAATQRGAELTHRLLAFSRKQSLRPQHVAIDDVIRGMYDLLRRTVSETISIELDLQAGLTVTIDPAQLENALLNLTINARDAMPEGGRIFIQSRDVVRDIGDRDVDGPIEPGQYAQVRVRDDGEGMDQEILPRIFEPFYSTKGQGRGSGLGLSMIYGFVKQSGGYVGVTSEKGRGTEFTIDLPAAQAVAEPETDEVSTPQEAYSVRDQTILVVEDEPSVRAVTVRMLNQFGYRTLEAPDAETALKIAQSKARIDLLLSDVVLQQGNNGIDLARRIIRSRPGLQVLFCSGYAEDAILEQGGLDKNASVLWKPYRATDLAQAISEKLNHAKAS